MKIALFDIDGTILWSRGAGRRSMERALTGIFDTPGPAGYRYDGKTDKQIVRETMQHEGFSVAEIDSRMDVVLDRYVHELVRELAGDQHGTALLPGVATLLDAVEQHDDIVLGLLTGNLVRGAEHKLRVVGVDPGRFVVGAFGSDHEVRSELPAIARQRACEVLGRDISAADCVIIGDTPNDVACSRPIGAKAIAVATGHYDVAALAACGPEAVFADLSDTDAVLQAIINA